MVSTSLIYPTEKIETSSDGASQNVFTIPWNLSQFEVTSATNMRSVEVEMAVGPNSLNFKLRVETNDKYEPSTMLQRIAIIYMLFTQIPDEGLDELLDVISDISSFYELVSKPHPALLPESRRAKVKLKAPTIRPEFPILPDEV